MSKIYGYCRISRPTQNIERQERNILAEYPNAIIIKEAHTGTKIHGRIQLDKLLKTVKPNDTIVFDSASRMSRNTDEAMELYEQLFNNDIRLVFLNERHIDSDVYKRAKENQIKLQANTGDEKTDKFLNHLAEAINDYMLDLAKEQIRIVFEQAKKEVDDLHKRTSQGIETARLNGKQIGQKKGIKLTTQKSIEIKKRILDMSKRFNGDLNDKDCISLIRGEREDKKFSRNTFYKYVSELNEEQAE